jgi:hypothetical protein
MYTDWSFYTLTEVFINLTEVFLTLTEGFPCFFLSCRANARVKVAKMGHGPHSSTLYVICVVRLLFLLFCVFFVPKCVLPPCDNPTAGNKYIVSYHIICSVLASGCTVQFCKLYEDNVTNVQYMQYKCRLLQIKSNQIKLVHTQKLKLQLLAASCRSCLGKCKCGCVWQLA